MRSVNVAELKNRLSTYLTYAKAGEEVVIRDRNRPVAKLVPFVAVNATEDELALVAEGVMPRVKSGRSAIAALLADREESL